jgi:hypothetical protein
MGANVKVKQAEQWKTNVFSKPKRSFAIQSVISQQD